MHKPVIPTLIVLFALIGTFSAFPQSFAGVTNGGPVLGASDCEGPSNESNVNAMIFDTERVWVVDPHEIIYDPNFGPWQKNLLPVGGVGSFDVDDDTTGGDQTFFLITEEVTVGQGLPFTDWHEELDAPGWEWQEGTISNENFVDDVEGMIVDNTIWFFFNQPLVPGTILEIEKEFAYVGPLGGFDSEPTETAEISDTNPLVLVQFPTTNGNNCEVVVVGGELISIDSTVLLISSVHQNSIWLLLVISGIIIGIFIFQRK